MSKVCEICPHHCTLSEGQTGFCQARRNVDGRIAAINYAKVTSIALDPIEKKPLRRFYPGSFILSVGSFGCNLRCGFCQNHEISMVGEEGSQALEVLPEALVGKALELVKEGNVGIAYTYNEPLVGYEFVMDAAKLARERGLKNVVVSNGFVCEEPFRKLLPYIDAVNIDLKGFTDAFYRNVKGDLETVKGTIGTAREEGCHVEVTTLVVPGENDSEREVDELARWLAGVDDGIALHLTRFYPRYRYEDASPTSLGSIRSLAGVAGKWLKYVY